MNLRALAHNRRAAIGVAVAALVVAFLVLRHRASTSSTSLVPTSPVTPQYDPATGAYIDPTTGAALYPSSSGIPSALGGDTSGLGTGAVDPTSSLDELTNAVGALQSSIDALPYGTFPGTQDPAAVPSSLNADAPTTIVVSPLVPDGSTSIYPVPVTNPFSGEKYPAASGTGIDASGNVYINGTKIGPAVSGPTPGTVSTAPIVPGFSEGTTSFTITPEVIAAASKAAAPKTVTAAAARAAAPAPSSPRTQEAAPITSSVARPAAPLVTIAPVRPYTPPAPLPKTVTVKSTAGGRMVAV